MNRKFPAYLDWVRSLPCADPRCCLDGRSEAHHFIGEFHVSGVGLKSPDYLAMPMCHFCHMEIHRASVGWKDTQREALIRTLIRAFEEGMIVVDGCQVHEPLPTRNMETK